MTVRATVVSFTLDLPHLRSEFEALSRLGEYSKLANNVYRWHFPLVKLEAVQIALGGKLVEFDKDEIVRDILPHCEPLMKELQIQLDRKGKGTIVVDVLEEGYVVKWWQRGEEKKYTVACALVEKAWYDVISQYPMNEAVETKKFAEDFINALELHHWTSDPLFMTEEQCKDYEALVKDRGWRYDKTGNFNWKYLFGDRAHLFHLIYAPIKVLVGLKMVVHRRDGHVIRILERDEFDKQKRFREVVLLQEQEERECEPPEKRDDILEWTKTM